MFQTPFKLEVFYYFLFFYLGSLYGFSSFKLKVVNSSTFSPYLNPIREEKDKF